MKNQSLDTFLQTMTSTNWLKVALNHIPLLLVDHAHCEKKAAATAMGMIYRYSEKPVLLERMSKLAREELRHFEQVLRVIDGRSEKFYHLPAGQYAIYLHQHVTNHDPLRLVDGLIVGAYIEARSCERFRLLSQHIDGPLSLFYKKLYLAEARHFEIYLELARHFATNDIEKRILFFGQLEAEFIKRSDDTFRFHSGEPS